MLALRFATFLIGLQAGLDTLGKQAEYASREAVENILQQTTVRWRSDSCTGPNLPPVDLEIRVSDWAKAVARETPPFLW